MKVDYYNPAIPRCAYRPSLFMYRSAKRRRGAFRIWIGSAPIRTLDMHIRPMDTVFGVRIGRRTHPFFGYALFVFYY